MLYRRVCGFVGLIVATAVLAGVVHAQEAAPGADKGAAPIWRTYDFQVVSTDEKPIVGATVKPWAVAHGNGGMGLGEKLAQPLKTDAQGKFQLVIRKDAHFIPTVEEYGLRSFAFNIDHPDHPIWSDYVEVEGERKIILADSVTIIVRVRAAEGTSAPRDLFPVPATKDFAERDGIVTIRRVDLTSESASPWLRIVQAPAEGPQRFTDLINIRQHAGPTISLEAKLKPGVRVAGRLADNVPRPIHDGRVLATVIAGENGGNESWEWSAATGITPDGTFTFDSLPEGDTVQLIAVCRGWVSASTTSKEADEYEAANNFTIAARDKESRVENRVYPRLHRLTAPQIEPLIPMEATLSCLVTVVDDNGLPIPNARVGFWPNQMWFHGGSQILGDESDSLASLRAPRKTGDFALGPRQPSYSQRTDAGGTAFISGLPFAFGSGATLSREYDFMVSHDDYELAADAAVKKVLPVPQLKIQIEPGQIGQITVRMQRK